MPKKIPKNQKTKSQKQYTESDVQACIQAVRRGMSKTKASLIFGIPRATLIFRMSDKFVKVARGPDPILTAEEEQKLVQWLIDSNRRGFPRKNQSLILSAKAFLDQNPRKNPFTNNTPGPGWPKAFLKRHPIIEEKTKKPKKQVTGSDVKNWFTKTTTYLREQGLDHILQDPSRVYEVDESPVQMSSNGKVLHEAKNRVEDGSVITVMITFSANGNITPPMIIYPNERKTQKIVDSVPKHWIYKVSKEGMDTQFFEDYITNILFPYLVRNNVIFPIILFVDGNTLHVTYAVNQLCVELRIILIALYPNATKLIDSSNKSLLKPLKTSWEKGFEEWKKENQSKTLTKENFAPILKKVIEACQKSKSFVNGFKEAGIYPWNSQVVDYGIYIPKSSEKSGSSNKTQTCSEVIDSTILDYKTFKEIIGPEVLQECEKYDSSKEHSKYFRIIYDLWSAFQNQALRMPENLAFDINDIFTMNFKEEVPNLLESNKQEDSDLMVTSDEGENLSDDFEITDYQVCDPLEIQEKEENLTEK